MSKRRLIDVDTFRTWARDHSTSERAEGVFRMSSEAPAAAQDGSRRIRFCFSDGSIDRAGDTIDPKGWETDDFLKNPVALWAHNSWEPPIGRAGNLAVEGKRLMGDIEFAAAEIFPFADTIYRLVAAKYINAVSVGFLPLEWSFVEDKDRRFGIDFIRQELLEISVVPVPCNANALIEARSKGIDTGPLMQWAERLLDQGGSILIPRKLLEDTFKAAKTPRTVRQKYLRSSAAPARPAPTPAIVPAPAARPSIDPNEERMSDDKFLTALRTTIAAEFKRLKIKAPAGEGESDGAAGGDDADDDDNGPNAQAKFLRAADVHVKSARALHEAAADLHKKARGLLQKAVDHFDDPEAEKGQNASPEDNVRAAHGHLKAASDLSAEGAKHHEKAETMLGKAIDHIGDPEAEDGEDEGDEKAAAQARVREHARQHASETTEAPAA